MYRPTGPALPRPARHLLLLLALAVLVGALPAASGHAQGQRNVVERWRGTITISKRFNTAGTPAELLFTGQQLERYTLRYDLAVDDDGFTNGDVFISLTAISAAVGGAGNCGVATMMRCSISMRIDTAQGEQFWEGRRFLDSQGKPRLKLEREVGDGVSPTISATMCGLVAPLYQSYICMPGETTDWVPDVPLEFTITPYQHGRQPLATPLNAHYSDPTIAWDYEGQLVGVGRQPALGLDTELLERSRFFSEVSVDDRLDATVDWNSADAGTVVWQIGPRNEQVGPTRNRRVTNQTNVGLPGPGTQQVLVQARNTLNLSSEPATTQVTAIRWPVSAEAPGNVRATKLNGVVAYRYALRFPAQPFTGKIDRVPDIVPYLRGKPLGLADSQAGGEVEILSTGEGYGKLDGRAGFTAMGGTVTGGLYVKAQAVHSAQYGVQYPSGEFNLTLAGKLEKTEPLVMLVPPIGAAAATISRYSPTIQGAINALAVQAEIEPKIDLLFKLKDNQGRIEFVSGEARPSFGIKTNLVVELAPGTAFASVGVGAQITQGYRVPAPYLMDTEIKLTGTAKIIVGNFQFEREQSVTCLYTSLGLSCRVPRLAALQAELSATANLWSAIDRSYTQHPDYGRWTGAEPAVTGPGVSDQRLVAALTPHASPAIVIAPNDFYGTRYTYVVWAHDHADLPLASARELTLATEDVVGGWSGPQRLTSDDRDDWNPQLALAPSGAPLVVWQRMDTATPPDINADAGAYLSHMQIAAGKIALGSAARVAPLQLSSGGLSHNPQLGGTSTGGLATWISNPANQLGGDAAHPDTLMWSRYTESGNTWSPAAAVLPALGGLVDYRLATNGANAAIAFTRDTDGNLATLEDREIFVSRLQGNTWSAPQQITRNTVPDELPQLALAADGNPMLVWRQAGAMQFLAGSWTAAPRALPLPGAALRPDYQLVRAADDSLALVWQDGEPGDTRVGYAVYDRATGLWGDQRTIAPPVAATAQRATMATAIAPALAVAPADSAKERLIVAYLLADVASVTRTVDGTSMPNVQQVGAHSLHVVQERVGANLSLSPSAITVTPADARPGQTVQVQVAVRNTGQLPVDGVPVELLSADPEDIYGQPDVVQSRTLPRLRAGDTYTVTYSLPRPEEGRRWGVNIPQVYEQCDSCSPRPVETDYTDNYAAIGGELRIAPLPATSTPQGIALSARVTQTGALYSTMPTSATLRLGAPDGPVVADVGVAFPISRTATLDATAWISPTVLGAGSHTLFWQLDPGRRLAERDQADNSFAVQVDVLPDLATAPGLIGWGRSPGATAPLSMRVENHGSWASAASAADLWDGPPGAAGSHKLGRVAVPAIAAGGFAELTGTLQLAGLPAAQRGLAALYVQLDPDGRVAEVNENNNLIVAGQPTAPTTQPPPPGNNRLYLPLLRR